MTPIEIAGERIEEADIPDNNYFREHLDPGYTNSIEFALCPSRTVSYRGIKFMLDDNAHYWLPVVAAVARCYFLDKAEATTQAAYGTPSGNTRMELMQQVLRYEQSAAKWARIGRAKA